MPLGGLWEVSGRPLGAPISSQTDFSPKFPKCPFLLKGLTPMPPPPGFGVCLLGFGIWGLGSGVWGRRSEIRGWRPGLGSEVWDLGLGSGVWDLGSGFGIKLFGLRDLKVVFSHEESEILGAEVVELH